MKCSEIMKEKIECLTPGESVQEAARRMRDNNVGFLPVCDEAEHVLGTLTDRDLAVRILAEGMNSDTPVDQVMTREVVGCAPDDDLIEAQSVMARHHKSRILCVDDEERLVGVISLSDIAQYEAGDRAANTLRQVSEREARP